MLNLELCLLVMIPLKHVQRTYIQLNKTYQHLAQSQTFIVECKINKNIQVQMYYKTSNTQSVSIILQK